MGCCHSSPSSQEVQFDPTITPEMLEKTNKQFKNPDLQASQDVSVDESMQFFDVDLLEEEEQIVSAYNQIRQSQEYFVQVTHGYVNQLYSIEGVTELNKYAIYSRARRGQERFIVKTIVKPSKPFNYQAIMRDIAVRSNLKLNSFKKIYQIVQSPVYLHFVFKQSSEPNLLQYLLQQNN